jgi:hypothetical protein
MFEPRQIADEVRLTTKQRVVVFIMNLLLLAELTYAMYLGQHSGDDLTEVFLWNFVPLAVGTLVLCKIVIRKLQPRPVAECSK